MLKVMIKIPSFKDTDHVRISKYEDIFAKYYTSIGMKRFLLLKKVKILYCVHMLLMILTLEKLLTFFTKNNCKKKNRTEFRVEKIIKKKGDKLYVIRKGCNNSFISWIDKNIHCVNIYYIKWVNIFLN